jgi:phosphatidylglycerol---prolipoprotein diacylglyceryl transferase
MIPFPDISPNLFEVELFGFTLALRWYALAYIAGILFAWWVVLRAVRTPRLWAGEPPLTPDQVERFLTWAIVGVILGGRLGYVLFYDLPTYLADPLQIVRVWEGGMVLPAREDPDAVYGRSSGRCGPRRADAGPSGQLHQRRALGPSD